MEKVHTHKLFAELYSGNPWIDVNILDTLNNIDAETAAKNYRSLNSIWQIVNHMIEWRLNILKRLNGDVIPTPADNYFKPLQDKSEAAWKTTLSRLEHSQIEWLAALSSYHEQSYSDQPAGNSKENYWYIQGVIQHDSYHLGQIVIISKLANS